jgi:hypothetical protein
MIVLKNIQRCDAETLANSVFDTHWMLFLTYKGLIVKKRKTAVEYSGFLYALR